jgi:hypothetical protein
MAKVMKNASINPPTLEEMSIRVTTCLVVVGLAISSTKIHSKIGLGTPFLSKELSKTYWYLSL